MIWVASPQITTRSVSYYCILKFLMQDPPSVQEKYWDGNLDDVVGQSLLVGVAAPGLAQLTHDFSAWIRYPGRHTWTDLWRIMPESSSYASVVGWIREGHWIPCDCGRDGSGGPMPTCCPQGICSGRPMIPCGIKPGGTWRIPGIGAMRCGPRRRKQSKLGDSMVCSWW